MYERSVFSPIVVPGSLFAECMKVAGMSAESIWISCAVDVCAAGPMAACLEFETIARSCGSKGFRLQNNWRTQLQCRQSHFELKSKYILVTLVEFQLRPNVIVLIWNIWNAALHVLTIALRSMAVPVPLANRVQMAK